MNSPMLRVCARLSFILSGFVLAAWIVGGKVEAAETKEAARKPVNLSRLLGGASIQMLNSKAGSFVPVPGLSAAIDDDASSGWTPPVGKTVLLLTLPQEADLSTVTLFAPGAIGEYQLYPASSAEAALTRGSTAPAVSGSLDKAEAKPVSGVRSKFVIVEINVVESAPLRSIDVVGSVASTAGGQVTVVTPKAGEQNAGQDEGQLAEVNFAASTLGATIASGDSEAFGNLIDGNTGTHSALTSGNGKPATISINLGAAVDVDRVSLAFTEAVGTVSFVASNSESPEGRLLGEVKLTGTSKTLTIETPGINAESITIVWQPAEAGTPLVVSEVGVFALARIIRSEPEPDGSTTVSVQPIGSAGGPPPRPPINPRNTPPPPILPPSSPVSG